MARPASAPLALFCLAALALALGAAAAAQEGVWQQGREWAGWEGGRGAGCRAAAAAARQTDRPTSARLLSLSSSPPHRRHLLRAGRLEHPQGRLRPG